MGEFLSFNRAKKQAHNQSSLTEHHNLSRDHASLRRAGTQRDQMRASSSSYTDRHQSKDPFEKYLRNRHEEKQIFSDIDEVKANGVHFDLPLQKSPKLVMELDPDDPMAKIARTNPSQDKFEVVQEDSDIEIKFPFSKKADRGDKNKKVEFKKVPAGNGNGLLLDPRFQKVNGRSLVRPKILKSGKSSHHDLMNRKENEYKEDYSHDSPRGFRYSKIIKKR